jgi:hypothetical protein
MWHPFKGGETIGQEGSESGIIIADEEYNNSCRITIEKDGCTAPYSITCGIYGLMCHTVFSDDEFEVQSKFKSMKQELHAFMESNDNEYEWCNEFTSKW